MLGEPLGHFELAIVEKLVANRVFITSINIRLVDLNIRYNGYL